MVTLPRSQWPLLLVALLSTGCAPGLLVTRRIPPEVDPGPSVRSLTLLPEGDAAVIGVLTRNLERKLTASGTYTLVALCGEQSCGPIDAWVQASAGVSMVVPPEKDKEAQETKVQVDASFTIIATDGAVLASRQHSGSRSGKVGKAGVTVDSLVADAVEGAVSDFVSSIVPRRIYETIAFDDSGPLKAPVKRALSGDLDGAWADFTALLAANPDLAGAHHDLGVIAEVKGDFAAAEALYTKAASLESKPLFLDALPAMQARLADSRQLHGR